MAKKKRSAMFKVIMSILAIGLLIISAEVVTRLMGFSGTELVLKSTGLIPNTRMGVFGEQPDDFIDDLIYLSYIDSLANEGFHIPKRFSLDKNIAQVILEEAGISQTTAESWGVPLSKPVPIKDLYLTMHKENRLILPKDGLPLYLEFKEGTVGMGYLIFGKTQDSDPDVEIDFCAVVSQISKLWTERSKIIYINPESITSVARPRIVHSFLEDIPYITYLGAAKIGNDIDSIFKYVIRPTQNGSLK